MFGVIVVIACDGVVDSMVLLLSSLLLTHMSCVGVACSMLSSLVGMLALTS